MKRSSKSSPIVPGEVAVAALAAGCGEQPPKGRHARAGRRALPQVFFARLKREVEAEATDDVFQAVVVERGDGVIEARRSGSGLLRSSIKPLAQVFDGLQGVAACLALDDFAG